MLVSLSGVMFFLNLVVLITGPSCLAELERVLECAELKETLVLWMRNFFQNKFQATLS